MLYNLWVGFVLRLVHVLIWSGKEIYQFDSLKSPCFFGAWHILVNCIAIEQKNLMASVLWTWKREMFTVWIKSKTENWEKSNSATQCDQQWYWCNDTLSIVLLLLLAKNKFEGEQWCHFPAWLRVKFLWPASAGLELCCCRMGCFYLLILAGTNVCVAGESAGSACCFMFRQVFL